MISKVPTEKQVNLIHTHINSIRTLINKLEKDNLKTAKYTSLLQNNVSVILKGCREMELEIRRMLENIK